MMKERRQQEDVAGRENWVVEGTTKEVNESQVTSALAIRVKGIRPTLKKKSKEG